LKGEPQVKVRTRTGIGTYITEVLLIQEITRQPSPVSKFQRGKSTLF